MFIFLTTHSANKTGVAKRPQSAVTQSSRRLTCPSSYPSELNTSVPLRSEHSKTLDSTSAVHQPDTNVVSQSTTLAGERPPPGRNTSPNGSLKVTSWDALPIFCVHLKQFDLNLYMGSAMGLTRMTIDNLFCDGRASIHSSGRKNTMLCAGLGTCQFTSEGGGVGGEFCLLDSNVLLRLDDDPSRDPEHNLDCRIRGFQLRVEYMSTNILLLRLNSLSLHLQDEWKLRDVMRQQMISNRPPSGGSDHSTRPAITTISSLPQTVGFEQSELGTFEPLEADIGVPPVYTAIVRTTTPDLMRAVLKVREYFEEQVREGRMSLIGQSGSFGLFSTNARDQRMTTSQWPGWHMPRSLLSGSEKEPTELTETEKQIIDKLLQRHWQGLYEAVKTYAYEHLGLTLGMMQDEDTLTGADEKYPVLGGSFQLSGRSLGIACFAGSFRSAPDWAIFNIQYPTACFETEAQREAPVIQTTTTTTPGVVPDPSEADGWVNFPIQFPPTLPATASHPFMDVLTAPTRSQAPHRRPSDPSELVPPDLTAASTNTDDPCAARPWRYRLSGTTTRKSSAVVVATVTCGNVSSPVGATTTTVTTATSSHADLLSDAAVGQNNMSVATAPSHVDSAHVQSVPVRSNPLRPPTDAEILFVLPSISLRITSDQRQTMAQPSLSTVPFIQVSVTTGAGETQEPAESEPSHSEPPTASGSGTESVSKSSRLWIYGSRDPSATRGSGSGNQANTPSATSHSFAPSVKISFQTDFHGFVQLGLIDVPWLPTLINSYLNERLQEYEFSSMASASNQSTNDIHRTFGMSHVSNAVGTELTARLRQLAGTSSPLVLDARSYEIVHWSLSPECRWLLATSIGVPAFDRLLESIGFRKARITIPKWLQRGVMDHLDHVTSILLRASLRLITDEFRARDQRSDDPRINTDRQPTADSNSGAVAIKAHEIAPAVKSKLSISRPSFTLATDDD
ncbi:unnamed protein product [Echinostoma caproni]|uniref:Bridge-like lipid transfer protein family member 1 C-terminal domain-containing protein n=1 Tax=Echinostoma caproni TaxID=27848 RepID=A0A3P8I4A6_9TREM|nr:unnamed protein product [Echinostoma caproni]